MKRRGPPESSFARRGAPRGAPTERFGRDGAPLNRGPSAPPARPHGAADAEEITPGIHAGLAVFAHRRDDIVRVLATSAARRQTVELARWAAAAGVPFREVDDRDLERASGSSHHEGLCVVSRSRRWAPIAEIADLLVASRATAIALDRVRNPYNVGAILRSAAFFGLRAAVLGAPAPSPDLSPTAVRVAEGGVEALSLGRTTDLADSLTRLRARGIRVVGADARASHDARRYRFDAPCILVVGHEREGLGPRVRAACDAVVAVHPMDASRDAPEGAPRLDSLNVAVAAGVLMFAALRGA